MVIQRSKSGKLCLLYRFDLKTHSPNWRKQNLKTLYKKNPLRQTHLAVTLYVKEEEAYKPKTNGKDSPK